MNENAFPDQIAPNILIIDDVPANLQILSKMLKSEGYRGRPVPNGLLAMKVAEKEKPDLVLLDILMRHIDGFEVCRLFKENEFLKDIPVIFISALNDTSNIVKALKTGGVDYITKPFIFEEVKAKVATHLKLYKQNQELLKRSHEKEIESRILEKLLVASDEFLKFSDHTPDYSKILQTILDISGARYGSLNIFDENGLDFTTVALAGNTELINKAFTFLGFDLLNKHWKHDPHRAEMTRLQNITRFDHLNELTGDTLSKKTIVLIEKTFNVQETFLVKILKQNRVLGDFTLVFSKGETLAYPKFVELFAHQVGMFFERNKITNTLRLTEAKSSAILHTLPDMLFIQNKEGVYLDFYLPENAITFDPPKVFVGQKMENVLPEKIIKEFEPVIENAIITGEITYYNYPLQMPDKLHYFEARIMSYDENIFINIVRDVTVQKEIEIELNLKNERLTRADIEKDLFMSILAHDLKSPFNALLGLTELLVGNIRNYNIEKIENLVGKIYNSTQSIYNLLDDLLLWTRSQSGLIPFNPQKLNSKEIFEYVTDIFKLTAEGKNITVNLPSAKGITVFADADMMKTILRNLLSNAIKFTNPGGKIDIKINQGVSTLTISVSDNGIGLDKNELARLFNISQVQTIAGTANEKGTGLGLFLCKEFADHHNGKIWVESEKGKGSTFFLSLPVNKN